MTAEQLEELLGIAMIFTPVSFVIVPFIISKFHYAKHRAAYREASK